MEALIKAQGGKVIDVSTTNCDSMGTPGYTLNTAALTRFSPNAKKEVYGIRGGIVVLSSSPCRTVKYTVLCVVRAMVAGKQQELRSFTSPSFTAHTPFLQYTSIGYCTRSRPE